MNLSLFIKIALAAAILASCGPRIIRVDDARLKGIPEERRTEVEEAHRKLVMARAEIAESEEKVEEAEIRLRIARASLEVAQAKVRQRHAEFRLTSLQGDSAEIVQTGGAHRAAKAGVTLAEHDVDVARAALRLARADLRVAERRKTWLDAVHELEKVRLVLQYDDGAPEEKGKILTRHSDVVQRARARMKEAEDDQVAAEAAFVSAETRRKAFELELGK